MDHVKILGIIGIIAGFIGLIWFCATIVCALYRLNDIFFNDLFTCVVTGMVILSIFPIFMILIHAPGKGDR